MHRIGPYSHPPALAKLDGRSKETKLLAAVRADLVAHVGGRPSATQKALIDRAAWLSLHVAQLDALAAAGRDFSERDSRHYLAWSNSLTRTLAQLGLKGAPAPTRTLADHIAGAAA